jgi:hypothetical protein
MNDGVWVFSLCRFEPPFRRCVMDYKTSSLVPALYLVLVVTVVAVASVAFVIYRPEPSERITEQLETATGRELDPRLSPPASTSTDSFGTSESYAKAVQRILQLEELLNKRTKLLEQKSALLDRREDDYRELRNEVDDYVMLLSQSSPIPKSPNSPTETPIKPSVSEESSALQVQLEQLKSKLSEHVAAERQLESELDLVKEDLNAAYAEMAEQQLAAALVGQDNAVAGVSARLLVRMGPEVLPSIVDLLSDRRADVRVWAVDVLGQFGPLAEDAVPQLREVLMDSDPRVRAAAERSISIILD